MEKTVGVLMLGERLVGSVEEAMSALLGKTEEAVWVKKEGLRTCRWVSVNGE